MADYETEISPAPESRHQQQQQQQEEESKKVSFRFCRECSNMLYPLEDTMNQKLMFACRSCQYSEDAPATCIYRNSLKEEVAETAGNVLEVTQDPTLPHTTEETCPNPKCGAANAVFFQSQQRNNETGMALFFVCCDCSQVWSTLDNQK